MITDEMLFYGGVVVAGIVLVLAIILFVIFYIDKIKLNLKFDKEYGEIPRIQKSKKI